MNLDSAKEAYLEIDDSLNKWRQLEAKLKAEKEVNDVLGDTVYILSKVQISALRKMIQAKNFEISQKESLPSHEIIRLMRTVIALHEENESDV